MDMSKEKDNDQIIKIAMQYLIDEYSGAAAPLWELDDDGNEIYTDPGCVDWTVCDYFNILLSPPPEVDEYEGDENFLTVTIQAEVSWSHWENILMIREFDVALNKQDSQWVVAYIGWDDVGETQLEGDGDEIRRTGDKT
jgi:hypothetical protein